MESKGKASVRLTGDPIRDSIHEIKLIAYELLRVTNLSWISEKSRAILA